MIKSITIECKPYMLWGVSYLHPLHISSMDEYYINGKRTTREFAKLIGNVLNNMMIMADEIPDFFTNKYDYMSARVKITGVLKDDLFAQFEAELISDNPIVAESSGEGKSVITKTANKGDIIYLDTLPLPSFHPEIGEEYHFNFVQSLYAKNNQKPLVLHSTFILP